MSVYPGAFDAAPKDYTDWTGDPASAPATAVLDSAAVDLMFSALVALETALGLNPQGAAASVAARVAAVEAALGKIGGTVAVTGTPTAGQVPTATSGTAATWQTPAGGSSITFTDRAAWAAATAYVVGDIVTQAGLRYVCKTAHTSAGSFAVGTNWVALDVDLSGTYGRRFTPTVQTTTYTAATWDLVLANAASGGFTVTLPASPTTGDQVAVKKTDTGANVVTVVAAGKTIDGDANATVVSEDAGGIFTYDGTNWRVTSVMTTITGGVGTSVSSVVGQTGAVTGTQILADSTVAAALAAKAPLASPTFTGTPAAPTAAVDTNTTQVATTAMVLAQAAAATPLVNGTAAVGTSTRFARGDHVHGTDTTRAPVTESVNTVGTSGAAQTIPAPTTQSVSRITLTANCTLTFPTATTGQSFTLVLVQDGTGSRTVTWPASAKWPAGTAPTLSTGAGKVDYLTFVCTDGSTWSGFVSGLDVR